MNYNHRPHYIVAWEWLKEGFNWAVILAVLCSLLWIIATQTIPYLINLCLHNLPVVEGVGVVLGVASVIYLLLWLAAAEYCRRKHPAHNPYAQWAQ